MLVISPATIPLSFLKFKGSAHAVADSTSLNTTTVDTKTQNSTYLSKVAF